MNKNQIKKMDAERIKNNNIAIQNNRIELFKNCNWVRTQIFSIEQELLKHNDNKNYPYGDYAYISEKITKTENTLKDIKSFLRFNMRVRK